MSKVLGVVRVGRDEPLHLLGILGICLGAGGIAGVDIDQLAIKRNELDFLDGHIHIGGKCGCVNGNLMGHDVSPFNIFYIIQLALGELNSG